DAKLETQRAAALTEEQRAVGRAMVLLQTARQQGKSDGSRALALLRQAVAESPELAEAHLELGRAVLQTGGDPEEAVHQFKLAWNLDPELAEPHYQIGLALLKMGRKAQALDELHAAASMAPCRVEIMQALGRAALDSGDRTTALREFRRVLAWDPE